MEVSVLKTIKRIRKEAPRRFAELRDQCDELIGTTFITIISRLTVTLDHYRGGVNRSFFLEQRPVHGDDVRFIERINNLLQNLFVSIND